MSTVRKMALEVAKALEDESRWLNGALYLLPDGTRVEDERDLPDGMVPVAACAEGHATQLFGLAATPLFRAFNMRFEKRLCDSNDYDGREVTIARLRELAEAVK